VLCAPVKLAARRIGNRSFRHLCKRTGRRLLRVRFFSCCPTPFIKTLRAGEMAVSDWCLIERLRKSAIKRNLNPRGHHAHQDGYTRMRVSCERRSAWVTQLDSTAQSTGTLVGARQVPTTTDCLSRPGGTVSRAPARNGCSGHRSSRRSGCGRILFECNRETLHASPVSWRSRVAGLEPQGADLCPPSRLLPV